MQPESRPHIIRPVPLAIGLGFFVLVAFGIYHWIFVAPVVAVFVEGVVWVAVSGAAVGWAYQRTVIDWDRHGWKWGLIFGALFAGTLIPFEIVGLLYGPFPEVLRPGDIVPLLPLAFLGLPVSIVIAWLINPGRGIAWSFVVATTVTHAILGGSIANFGGRGATFLMFVGFAVFEVLAGLALGLFVTQAPARPGGATATRASATTKP